MSDTANPRPDIDADGSHGEQDTVIEDTRAVLDDQSEDVSSSPAERATTTRVHDEDVTGDDAPTVDDPSIATESDRA